MSRDPRISVSFENFKNGAKESRTPDLFIANESLYQLSYSPNFRTVDRVKIIVEA